VIHRAPGAPAAVALTFDDGPSEWTGAIADALESHGCRGTFFVLGPAVERHPEVVARLAAAGHEVGNHLWSHADPLEQEPDEIRAELERTAQAVGAATGARPRLVPDLQDQREMFELERPAHSELVRLPRNVAVPRQARHRNRERCRSIVADLATVAIRRRAGEPAPAAAPLHDRQIV